MKILVDLTACQTNSRSRGIGRYSLELIRALIKQRGRHDVVCMADPLLSDGFEALRQEFIRSLPVGNFLPCHHDPIPAGTPLWDNPQTQLAATLIRQSRQAITPDLVLTPSFFEEWGMIQAVVPLPLPQTTDYKQVAILYDLIPYLFRDRYLDPEPAVRDWYLGRLGALQNFDLLLAISEATRQDAIQKLHIAPERVINISGAASPHFRKLDLSAATQDDFLKKLGIDRPFVFYLGGHDFRKNITGALRAFAGMPRGISAGCQLVVNSAGIETVLRDQARALGLSEQDVVLISRVTDEDLLLLYNLCAVFIFPSFYEGFGLPVLEAMACGAPTLAADNSSLPEVVGRADALFDASSPESMAAKIVQVLTDAEFREELSRYGLERARQFSWESTARRAWEAMEVVQQDSRWRRVIPAYRPAKNRERIAFLSPLPPQESGIAEYSAELLPHLSREFAIDLFVEPGLNLDDVPHLRAFRAYPYGDLMGRRDHYATVVYQHGNSALHAHMFELEQHFPGVVVLHDFFLSHLVRHLHLPKGDFPQELDYSHGLQGLIAYQVKGHDLVWDWPMNWRVLQNAKEVVVHSPFQKKLLDRHYRSGWQPRLNLVPQPRSVEPETSAAERRLVREQLGIREDSFVYCSFGFIAPTKLNEKVVESFRLAQLSANKTCELIFVGGHFDDIYREKLFGLLRSLDLEGRVHTTGFVEPGKYRKYFQAADAAIQLRHNSRGETSRAVLDCMAFGLPVILNRHGTLDDYRDEDVVKIADPVTTGDLARAMTRLQTDDAFRGEKGRRARNAISAVHAPETAAAAYAEVIYKAINADDRRLFKPALRVFKNLGYPELLLVSNARHAANNLAARNTSRILVDVSYTNSQDLRTGIQRVVKQIVKEWLHLKETPLSVEPVRIEGSALRRASRFVEKLLDMPVESLGTEAVVSVRPGDTLLLLDSSWEWHERFLPIFEKVRCNGGKIISAVYDLIPLYFPHMVDEYMPGIFSKWLRSAIRESDVLICMSQTVAEEVTKYRLENSIALDRHLDIVHFHLGADIPVVSGETEVRAEVAALTDDPAAPVFLCVGTIEPRKGHAFTLDAFELLWRQSAGNRLVFAGKVGWNVAGLAYRIRRHPLLGRKLFFIENPTDAELEVLYSKATALITASRAEGFGLPIVEAARHGVPALASDIPVFREVGGEGSVYFSLHSPKCLAKAVRKMATLTKAERAGLAKKVRLLTWKESAADLLAICSGGA